MRGIEDVKKQWGDKFIDELRRNNICLPSRMSQQSTK